MSMNVVKTKNSKKIRKIYERAKKKGNLTYETLAALLGVKENTLACWITGRRNPPDYVVQSIEQKVNDYLDRGTEFINKKKGKKLFKEAVIKIFDTVPQDQRLQEIIKAFDNLPVVTIKDKKNLSL